MIDTIAAVVCNYMVFKNARKVFFVAPMSHFSMVKGRQRSRYRALMMIVKAVNEGSKGR